MPEYSITTTGNFYHSRLEIIFFVIDYDPEIEATFIYWGDGRVVHTKYGAQNEAYKTIY